MVHAIPRHSRLFRRLDGQRLPGVRVRFEKRRSRACDRDADSMAAIEDLAGPADIEGDLVRMGTIQGGEWILEEIR